MKLLCFTLLLATVEAFLLQPSVNKCHIALNSAANEGEHELSRRSTLSGMICAASSVSLMTSFPVISNAVSNEKPKEFIDVGTQAPAPNGETEFIELANGVKVKDFRPGSGDETVKANSQVQIQASGRLLNLNGVVFYNTKNNNPDGFGAIPLTINLGKGEAIPGLEAGIVGMRKGGIRRIIIPADLAYSKFPDLEPKPMNANDQRALDSVVKNPRRDASILFDVSVERFK
ncbi:FKBP-like protein [Chaetoceros tenuissimus]|uniref:peptidylprolyl isomerase n=1 Tax=Chaetoceros tenuissimus TaxID=426638 RepID=A0AAD3HEK6_9STRA|nr:FKBP-like protein [Chaetoceros tenuissimus]